MLEYMRQNRTERDRNGGRMRERINRLARGIVDTEVPECVLKPAVIEETVRAGEAARGEFFVFSGNNLMVKGLVYSSDSRVRIPDNSFGGLRSRVVYEVDSEHLDDGEEIRGEFCLVTNSGEVRLPYVFRGEAGVSSRMLSQLKRPGDFARVAKENMELAGRLFEYKDFPSAPFMQDMRAKTVYHALKGSGDRDAAVEEFMVAMSMKPPVEVSLKEETVNYQEHIGAFEDSLSISKKNWGYIRLSVEVDGDFLEVFKTRITDKDFTDGKYELIYQVKPEKMHSGRNLGCITVKGIRYESRVYIVAEGPGQEAAHGLERIVRRKEFQKYLAARLDYEAGKEPSGTLVEQMAGELMKLRDSGGNALLVDLLSAETSVMMGKLDRAAVALNECRSQIAKIHHENPELYCFYQYLTMMVEKKPGQLETLLRLLRSYTEEPGKHFLLFFLLLKLDAGLYDNPGVLLDRMRQYFQAGCASPLLYIEVCRLLSGEPNLMKEADGFLVHALRLGVKKGLVKEALADKAAETAMNARRYNRLFCRLLTELYEVYPKENILAAVCCMMIKGEQTSAQAFSWYEKGLKEGISLTRLYEYYLKAFPDQYGSLMPQEVLLYFSYAKELDEVSRSKLYRNILTYLKPESQIYREYERDMEKFTMEQVFQGKVNRRLATLYEHMLYKDMIDIPVARILPSILRSYRIECKNPLMKYVIVCPEEMNGEEAYALQNGVAYVPLFSDKYVLVFQDGFGNRYMDVRYLKTRVMNRPDLESRCFVVYPEHPMLLLADVRKIVDGGVRGEEDVASLEKLLEQEVLSPLYQKVIRDQIISYYDRLDAPADGMERGMGYLLRMDKDSLDREERLGVAGVLIKRGYYTEACDILRNYGWEGLDRELLRKLCEKMILQNLFGEDEKLLNMTLDVFMSGKADSVLLDYLCEYYNGTTETMYRILEAGVSGQVETYDMEERLLAQMLFCSSMEHSDRVFELYAERKRVSEILVKAFFTMKSMDYFLDRGEISERLCGYLEHTIKGNAEKEKIPVVYLLALTKYYANVRKLTEDQKELCRSMMAVLLKEKLIFAYTPRLAKHISLPEDIVTKAVIQYNGRKDSRVTLRCRVLPEEEMFHDDEMKRVYQGIFVKQAVLFDGETLEYEIYDEGKQGRELCRTGKISLSLAGNGETRRDGLFSILNRMGLCLEKKDEEGLKREMNDYLIKTGTAELMFDLL